MDFLVPAFLFLTWECLFFARAYPACINVIATFHGLAVSSDCHLYEVDISSRLSLN